MLLEVRAASRKTPLDGRFEIAETTATRLSALDGMIPIVLDDVTGTAYVERMPCTCGKSGGAGAHEHLFLVSDLLRTATPDRVYALELDDAGSVRLTRSHEGLL